MLNQAKLPTSQESMLPALREQVPELGYSLDEWTLRMMHWHFSEDTGSPFWLARRPELPFDPLKDITDYNSLRLFGQFDIAELRTARVRDLLPRGFEGLPFRVVETGGTSGPPCRVVDVTRAVYDVRLYRTMLAWRGLSGGDVLAMTPSGPHAYGHFVKLLADSWTGATFFIDFDPRWVKSRLRSGADADDYVDHLVGQVQAILEREEPALLFTTSALLLRLAPALPRTLFEYGVRAVCTGGTMCTAEEARYLREHYLSGVSWIDTYGNTLMGHALQAGPLDADEPVAHHLPPPFATIHVVDPAEPDHDVPYGVRGRIRVTTLLEDLFLPGFLERDTAVRAVPHHWFPWDGVTEIGHYQATDDDTVQGVY